MKIHVAHAKNYLTSNRGGDIVPYNPALNGGAMKRMLFLLFFSLLLPTLASACFRVTQIVIPCGDCAGQGQLDWVCLGNQGYGSPACNEECYITLCEGDDCEGSAWQACTSGGNCDSASARKGVTDLPQASVLVPNSQGGYSESAIPRYSCAAGLGMNP